MGCKGEIKKGEDKLSVVMQLETDFDKQDVGPASKFSYLKEYLLP